MKAVDLEGTPKRPNTAYECILRRVRLRVRIGEGQVVQGMVKIVIFALAAIYLFGVPSLCLARPGSLPDISIRFPTSVRIKKKSDSVRVPVHIVSPTAWDSVSIRGSFRDFSGYVGKEVIKMVAATTPAPVKPNRPKTVFLDIKVLDLGLGSYNFELVTHSKSGRPQIQSGRTQTKSRSIQSLGYYTKTIISSRGCLRLLPEGAERIPRYRKLFRLAQPLHPAEMPEAPLKLAVLGPKRRLDCKEAFRVGVRIKNISKKPVAITRSRISHYSGVHLLFFGDRGEDELWLPLKLDNPLHVLEPGAYVDAVGTYDPTKGRKKLRGPIDVRATFTANPLELFRRGFYRQGWVGQVFVDEGHVFSIQTCE